MFVRACAILPLASFAWGSRASAPGARPAGSPEGAIDRREVLQPGPLEGHARREDRGGALRWLAKAFESHEADRTYMNLSWALRSLRTDPRYVALLRKRMLQAD